MQNVEANLEEIAECESCTGAGTEYDLLTGAYFCTSCLRAIRAEREDCEETSRWLENNR